MSKEVLPLQQDMFTGELVDSRSSYRKRLDKQQALPQQLNMFPVRETVQFGVSVRPWLKELPRPQMVLESEDPRTPEEIERDLMREAEAMTSSLFGGIPQDIGTSEDNNSTEIPSRRVLIPVFIAEDDPVQSPSKIIGYRAHARRAGVKLRTR